MTFGRLSPHQAERLHSHVRGRKVYDLGSSDDLSLSRALVELGATEVVAVDTYPLPRSAPNGVRYVRNYFENLDEAVDTAFISWPSNRSNPGLVELTRSASVVIYLGSCMDGNMCGSPRFFWYLSTREALEHVPERKNTLIVYGRERVWRDLLPEERAGIDHSKVYSFEETSRASGH